MRRSQRDNSCMTGMRRLSSWNFARRVARRPRWVLLAVSGGAVLTALVLSAFLTALRVEANAGPPFFTGGTLAAEPSGLMGVAITHETLDIDMRQLTTYGKYNRGQTDTPTSLERSNPIEVSAVYSITNSGPPREVPLVFASGVPSIAGFSALMNGQPVETQLADGVAVPEEWQPPTTTPGLDGHDLFYLGPSEETVVGARYVPYNQRHYPRTYARSVTSTYAFTVTLPMGDSALEVRYRAEPQQYREGGYTDFLHSYQFAYVLAPARAWDGFGGLDMTVRLPKCWLAASRPELERVSDALSGDNLHGSFESIPADALALTVAPCGSAGLRTQPPPFCAPVPAGFILPLGLLGLVLYRRTRRPA